MDDDIENGSEEDDSDALALGSQIILTTDEGYETGVLLGSGEAGIRLRVTHRVVKVEPSLTKLEKLQIEAVVRGMSAWQLFQTGREVVGKKALLFSRTALEDVVLDEALVAELGKKPVFEALKPLTRTVATFVPWHSVVKIVSYAEWEEEQVFRPFEASLASAGED